MNYLSPMSSCLERFRDFSAALEEIYSIKILNHHFCRVDENINLAVLLPLKINIIFLLHLHKINFNNFIKFWCTKNLTTLGYLYIKGSLHYWITRIWLQMHKNQRRPIQIFLPKQWAFNSSLSLTGMVFNVAWIYLFVWLEICISCKQYKHISCIDA